MSTEPAVPLSSFDQNRFTTYPHDNGFTPDSRYVILAQRQRSRHMLVRCEIETGETLPVAEIPSNSADLELVFREFELSADGQTLICVGDRAVWKIPMTDPSRREMIYRLRDNETLGGVPNLRHDSRRVLVPLKCDKTYCMVEIDVETGQETWRFEVDFWLGHAQYSPFDPSLVGFCHEGLCDTIPDRVWMVRAGDTPSARCIFDQHWDDPARRLFAGHERWAFHDRSVFVVAYGVSMGKPRGIYEAFADGRPQRLVSEGDRDWHLDVSRDGRWVAIDTTGPHDAPGSGWENAGPWSDVLVANAQTGERRFLARSRQHRHPSHPHPTFTPNGKWILYNEADETCTANRVMRVRNPWA